MKGVVRTYQKCPVCGLAYTFIERVGFFCSDHKTYPNRFVIDLFVDSRRIRIYSDKAGQVLDSYQRAYNLQAKITWEIENHTFDPSKYVRQDLKHFWVTELLDRFEKAKLPELAPSYQDDYKRMVRVAKGHFGTQDVRDLRKLDLINYKDALSGKSPKTVKNHIDHFMVFLNWCHDDLEILEAVPAKPEIDVPTPAFRWIPQAQIPDIYGHVPMEDRPIIGFLLLHGCRPAEARALRVGDVNLDQGTVTISATFSAKIYRPRRKGRRAKAYTIPIHPESMPWIRERCAASLPGAWLFPNPRTGGNYSKHALQKVWNRVRKDLGVSKELRLYDASRHSVASNLRASGADLSDIRDQLGHSDIKTTLKYAHGSQEKLRVNLERLTLNKVVTLEGTDCGPTVNAMTLLWARGKAKK